MENAEVRGEYMMAKLRKMQKSIECMGDVRGKGLMVGVELVKDRETKKRASTWRNEVVVKAFEKGLLLLGCGENTVRFSPALTVSKEEIDVCLSIFEEVLLEVTG
jgi:4-aminobutyrate aminotransferase